MSLRKILFMSALLFHVLECSAFLFFGFGTSSSDKPAKLYVLLRPVNELIEQADDAAYNGDTDKAIGHYKEAIKLLEKIKRDHPDRSETSEFQPLRNKLAVCQTNIDALQLQEINKKETRFAVSDTTELRKKYLEKQKKKNKKKADEKAKSKDKESVKNDDKKIKTSSDPTPKKEQNQDNSQRINSHIEMAKDYIAQNDFKKADSSLKAALKLDIRNWEARFLLTFVNLALQDFETADVFLVDLISEKPNDVPTLLLAGAVYTGKKEWDKAHDVLNHAIKINPKYYAPYYNMAQLLIEMKSDKNIAIRCYERGRAYGGPKDVQLEQKLGIKK